MLVFRCSESVPNTACTPLPMRMTPLAPSAVSARSSTSAGSLTATRKGSHQSTAPFVPPRGGSARRGGDAGLLTAGGLEVEPADGEAEDDVIDDRIDGAENQHQPPLLCEFAEYVENQEVDATLRKSEDHVHAERVGQELRRGR